MNLDLPLYLEGLPAQYGAKQPSPQFYQGESIVCVFPLRKVVNPEQWTDLDCVVKKSVGARNVLWKVRSGAGLKLDSEAFVMIMPAEVSAYFLPGSYLVALTGRQRVGTGSPVDLTSVLGEGRFDLTLSAASPNPKLAESRSIAVSRNEETGIITVVTTTTEPTLPRPADSLVDR